MNNKTNCSGDNHSTPLLVHEQGLIAKADGWEITSFRRTVDSAGNTQTDSSFVVFIKHFPINVLQIGNANSCLPTLDSIESVRSLRMSGDRKTIAFNSFCSSDDTCLSYSFAWYEDDNTICVANIIRNLLYDTHDQNKNLTLGDCLGVVLDIISTTAPAITPVRSSTAYDYIVCTGWENDKPLLEHYKTRKAAEANACYTRSDYSRTGKWTKQRLEDLPDADRKNAPRFVKQLRQDIQKLGITLLCHYGREDVRNFGTKDNKPDGGLWLLNRCVNIDDALITTDKPIASDVKSLVKSQNGALYFYPTTIQVRDTVSHTPKGFRYLEALAKTVRVPERYIDGYSKADETFISNNLPAFLNLASACVYVPLIYASTVYGIDREIPVTIGYAASIRFRELQMKYINCEDNVAAYDKDIRGLEKARQGKKADENGRLRTVTKMIPLTTEIRDIQQYASDAFFGGYNVCSGISYYPIPTFDHDLRNAYPTAACTIPDIDWSDPVMHYFNNQDLTLTDFISDPGNINPIPLFVGSVSFQFPHGVYPCLPIRVDGNPVFALSSSGEYVPAAGPEVVLALQLGATIHCKRGFLLRPRMRKNDDGTTSVSRSIAYSMRQLVLDRANAEELFGTGSLAEKVLKTSVNMIYGKFAQGVRDMEDWELGGKAKDNRSDTSIITNPIVACLITSCVRATLIAAQNQVEAQGGHCLSITTDGGIFDIPSLEHLDLYGLAIPLRAARRFLTDGEDDSLWSIKHAQDDLINPCRRGNVSQYTVGYNPYNWDGKSYSGVLARASIHSVLPKGSPEERQWFAQQVLSRTGPIPSKGTKWVPFKKQCKGYPLQSDNPKDSLIRVDYDMTQKPDLSTMQVVFVTLNSESYEMVNMTTTAFETVDEYQFYRKAREMCNCLRTKADWEAFSKKLERIKLDDKMSKDNGKKQHKSRMDPDYQILVACIMGYKLKMWDIPALNNLKHIDEKLKWINSHNDSSTEFNKSAWKNAGRSTRDNQMLPLDILMPKLMELGAVLPEAPMKDSEE